MVSECEQLRTTAATAAARCTAVYLPLLSMLGLLHHRPSTLQLQLYEQVDHVALLHHRPQLCSDVVQRRGRGRG